MTDPKKLAEQLDYLRRGAEEGRISVGDMMTVVGAMSYLETTINDIYNKYKKQEEPQENPFDWDNIKFLFGSRSDHNEF